MTEQPTGVGAGELRGAEPPEHRKVRPTLPTATILERESRGDSVAALSAPEFMTMDDNEIKRLRRAIQRTYGSCPHKKKVWLALLERQAQPRDESTPGQTAAASPSPIPVHNPVHNGGQGRQTQP